MRRRGWLKLLVVALLVSALAWVVCMRRGHRVPVDFAFQYNRCPARFSGNTILFVTDAHGHVLGWSDGWDRSVTQPACAAHFHLLVPKLGIYVLRLGTMHDRVDVGVGPYASTVRVNVPRTSPLWGVSRVSVGK